MVDDFKERLHEELEDFEEGSVVLMTLPPKRYDEINMNILAFLIEKLGYHGAYVAINRPYDNINKIMGKKGIQGDRFFFLDCVTEKHLKRDNCVFVKSVKSLTNIGIALEQIYRKKDLSFILVDSLDGFSVYHDLDKILRFARSEIERMREKK
tara:strand:- start:258 stop:716 length:459 start_codon:yes stop_codon:yes gene_type:complete